MIQRIAIACLFLQLLLLGCRLANENERATEPPGPAETPTVIASEPENTSVPEDNITPTLAVPETRPAEPTAEIVATEAASIPAFPPEPMVVEWGTRAPLLEPNSETAVTALDMKIYVIGGYPSSRVSVSTVQIYDAVQDRWQLTTPLPVPLNHTMAAAANGKVYVIGGQSTNSGSGPFLNSVFEFDPQTETWTLKAPMPTARGGGAAAVMDGLIYVVGGRPPQGHDFAVYDPQQDSWTSLPDMPTARNHLAATAIDGQLFVVGGRFGAGFNSDMTDTLEMYDPQTNTWTTKSPMPTIRGGLNAVAANGCLHVFGGEGSGGVFPQHELYNPITDSWLSLEPIPTPVHGVTGAAFLDGWIHLPGGGTEVGGSSGSVIHQVVGTNIICKGN